VLKTFQRGIIAGLAVDGGGGTRKKFFGGVANPLLTSPAGGGGIAVSDQLSVSPP
jgi:hypothetical protein